MKETLLEKILITKDLLNSLGIKRDSFQIVDFRDRRWFSIAKRANEKPGGVLHCLYESSEYTRLLCRLFDYDNIYKEGNVFIVVIHRESFNKIILLSQDNMEAFLPVVFFDDFRKEERFILDSLNKFYQDFILNSLK